MADPKNDIDEAFGIVPIFKQADKTHQFLLIQHHAGHWGFPKGHADPGESTVQTACREFREETGIAEFTVLDEVAFAERYNFMRDGRKFQKTVIYYPAFVQSTQVQCQPEEIQGYVWLDFAAASARLTFEGARRILAEVHSYLQAIQS
jgi:bis(5'-nucleosidyl)-tetraphosphatase